MFSLPPVNGIALVLPKPLPDYSFTDDDDYSDPTTLPSLSSPKRDDVGLYACKFNTSNVKSDVIDVVNDDLNNE